MNLRSRPFLYQVSMCCFCVIVIISNLLSAKLVTLPWIELTIPAGLITYPFSLLITDLVTEVFGAKRARFMIYLALAMNLLSLGLIQMALSLPTGGSEEQRAFQIVFGLSGIRIFSSLVAYAVSQVVDVQLYSAIKKWTGSKWLWLRNNGSSLASQLVDTVMIDILFLWWGLGMTMSEVFPIMLFSYLYKAFFSAACTPLFYLLIFFVRNKWRTPALKPKEQYERAL